MTWSQIQPEFERGALVRRAVWGREWAIKLIGHEIRMMVRRRGGYDTHQGMPFNVLNLCATDWERV